MKSSLGTIPARLGMLGREGAAYAIDLSRKLHPKQIRVVLFGQGRSGTTVLESLLVSTGHFHDFGEIFSRPIWFPRPYVNGRAKRVTPAHCLFHVKIYHLDRDRSWSIVPRDFLRSLVDDGWQVIYVRRENKVRQALSNFIGEHRRAWHKTDDFPLQEGVYVDCDHLIARVKERQQFDKNERAALEGLDFQEVIYESDLEQQSVHQATIDRLLDSLALERRPASTSYRRISATPYDRLIENYNEVRTTVRQQGWSDMLPA